MIYRVTARYIADKAPDFYRKLTDGTIKNQRPDGQEILKSMERAKISHTGTVEWYETCYCPTPLAHERSTVYDSYLTEINAVEVDDYGTSEGRSFWSYLQKVSAPG
jgi:hypothetical protein